MRRRYLKNIAVLLLLAGCVPQPRKLVDDVPDASDQPLKPRTDSSSQPKLIDFVENRAEFKHPTPSGLQMGESDTVVDPISGALVSFAHHGRVHSDKSIADFVGCTSIWRDDTGTGLEFTMTDECVICRTNDDRCYMRQQQYPRVFPLGGEDLLIVFENQARTFINYSRDFGRTWSKNFYIQGTGHTYCDGFDSIWGQDHRDKLRFHFDANPDTCLAGAPPGLYVDQSQDSVYVFVAQGANPGALGCLRAPLSQILPRLRSPPRRADGTEEVLINNLSKFTQFKPCHDDRRPVIKVDHGRFFSSADIVKENGRYYMVAEIEHLDASGHRWQLVFSHSDKVDEGWQLANNHATPFETTPRSDVGLGHGDLVNISGVWYLYTTGGEQQTRMRYQLVWK